MSDRNNNEKSHMYKNKILKKIKKLKDFYRRQYYNQRFSTVLAIKIFSVIFAIKNYNRLK